MPSGEPVCCWKNDHKCSTTTPTKGALLHHMFAVVQKELSDHRTQFSGGISVTEVRDRQSLAAH